MGNLGGVQAEAVPHMGRPYSLTLTVPPWRGLFLKWTPEGSKAPESGQRSVRPFHVNYQISPPETFPGHASYV